MSKKDVVEISELTKNRKKVRNIGIVAHIDHGKSTLTDSLLAGAGLLSRKIAGQARATDAIEEEQKRGITIQASAVSMVHKYEKDHYLINLIDTPGHVDFGGDVTRAMRAVDGALVVVDAVEGVMPQTETVLKQATEERVKPVLFINKVDRLLKELKLTPEEMQDRFVKIIKEVNKLIVELVPKKLADDWQVRVQDGSVAFGSAVHKWALSVYFMKKKGIGFKEVIDAYSGSDEEVKENIEKLSEDAPLHEVILDMTIKHHPNPVEAQKYRVPHIWKGDVESKVGKSLVNCDMNGETVFVVTKVKTDPRFGELSFGRIFSGTLKEGQQVYLNKLKQEQKAQRVFIMMIDKRTPLEAIPAGNTAAIIGLKGSTSGETISENKIVPFEEIKHLFEPVVTRAIEAANPADLPKLITVLREISKEDPTVVVKIDQESGEHLICGLGELHLEDVIDRRIIKERGLKVKASAPIVVYRESIMGETPAPVEGKSPNKHNKFYLTVKSMDEGVRRALLEGDVPETRIKRKDKEMWKKLAEVGLDKDEAKKVRDVYNGNLFIDETKGEVHMLEVIDLILDAVEQVLDEGPIAREPVTGVKIYLQDITLHEDSIHRGPAQVIPAVREALKAAFAHSDPVIKEPVQKIRIDTPMDFFGDVSKLLSSRRGRLLDTKYEGKKSVITAKIPVAESFGFMNDLRSITEGRGVWSLIDSKFEDLPKSLQAEVVEKIRKRKGLTANQ